MPQSRRDIDDDVMVLILLGVGAVSFGVVNVGVLSHAAVRWLVIHRVLVPDRAALLPLAGGVGVDGHRLGAVVGGLLLAAVFVCRLRRLRGDQYSAVRPGRGRRPGPEVRR
jgi:hypothetical protein